MSVLTACIRWLHIPRRRGCLHRLNIPTVHPRRRHTVEQSPPAFPTGTVHGFEIAEKSEIVNQSVAKRIMALKKAFKFSD